MRGVVTAVDARGVFVRTAEHGVLGPCPWTGNQPNVGSSVLVSDVGDAGSPDLVVVGAGVTQTDADARYVNATGDTMTGSLAVRGGSGIRATVESTSTANNHGAGVYLTTPDPQTGQWAQVSYQVGGKNRWQLQRTPVSESGGNAGSNFALRRFDDSGAHLGDAVGVSRATGRVTVGAAGTAAGVEMGSGGPTITTGTGAPSHTAPNGSLYLRTDGTAATTLYVRAAGAWAALS